MDGSYGSYGFPGLEVTDGSYNGLYGFDCCAGKVSLPQSYGRFLWMVPMVPMVVWAADGCPW